MSRTEEGAARTVLGAWRDDRDRIVDRFWQLTFRDGERVCEEPEEPAVARYALAPVPLSFFVRGTLTERPRGDLFVDRTYRYEDGAVTRVRQFASGGEPDCGLVDLDGRPDVRACVPWSMTDRRVSSIVLVHGVLGFADEACTVPRASVLDDVAPGDRLLLRNGTRFELRDVVRPRVDDDGAQLYVRDRFTDECRWSSRSGGVPVGPPIDDPTIPRLSRVALGDGRLRLERWVDDDGLAWPLTDRLAVEDFDLGYLGYWLGVAVAFLDQARGGERCLPFSTTGGMRCVPVASIRGGRWFLDADCLSEPVVRRWHGAEYAYVSEVREPGARCAEARRLVELRAQVGPAFTVPRVYERGPDGSCDVEEDELQVRRLGPPLAWTELAQVDLVESR
ncbi:MAG: hypothetical protein ACFCGT_19375 [Sandaracinaceae bacterium]